MFINPDKVLCMSKVLFTLIFGLIATVQSAHAQCSVYGPASSARYLSMKQLNPTNGSVVSQALCSLGSNTENNLACVFIPQAVVLPTSGLVNSAAIPAPMRLLLDRMALRQTYGMTELANASTSMGNVIFPGAFMLGRQDLAASVFAFAMNVPGMYLFGGGSSPQPSGLESIEWSGTTQPLRGIDMINNDGEILGTIYEGGTSGTLINGVTLGLPTSGSTIFYRTDYSNSWTVCNDSQPGALLSEMVRQIFGAKLSTGMRSVISIVIGY
jgi:hypothetical protein